MRSVLLVSCVLLSLAVALPAVALQKQTAPPKHQRTPKPKKQPPTVVLIQPIDLTNSTGMEGLMLRVGLLNVFKTNKKYEDVPPAEMQGIVDQLGIDFQKPENWTAANFDKIAQTRNALFVAATELVDLKITLPQGVVKKDGPKSMTASVDIASWLYDVKAQKFIMEGEKLHWDYMAHRGDDKLDKKGVGYEVIIQAVEHAYKDVPKAKG